MAKSKSTNMSRGQMVHACASLGIDHTGTDAQLKERLGSKAEPAPDPE